MKKTIKIKYLKKAEKFLDKNSNKITKDDVDVLMIKAVKKIYSLEDISIDLKKMKTKESYYRIRKGDIRIIFSIGEDKEIIISIVENIGYRGDIYKKS